MPIIKVAHRGASGYEAENTFRSFIKAIELNADMIELDVHLCKSGEVVVMHDDSVDRTTDGNGRIEDMTLTELKALEMAKGQRIPTLTEVLDLADKKIKLNIEIKGKGTAMQVRAIVENYIDEEGWNYDDFLISSFRHDELWQMKNTDPELRIGVLTEMIPPGFIEFAKKLKAYSVNVPIDKIDEKFVARAHKLGLKVFVYAANDTPEIDKAKKLKVDYICSDFPDKI